MAQYSKKAGEKVEKVMNEKKAGTLKSGRSGKKVTKRKQAVAIRHLGKIGRGYLVAIVAEVALLPAEEFDVGLVDGLAGGGVGDKVEGFAIEMLLDDGGVGDTAAAGVRRGFAALVSGRGDLWTDDPG